MSRNEVVEKDQGWNRIQDEMAQAKGSGVKVGVLGDAGQSDDGADMILIAAANEFGTQDGHIPARPFIRGSYDQNRSGLARTSQRLWDQVLAGRLTIKRALGLLGEQHQGQVQEYMTALDTPENAPRTVARKGSSNPLIDEGRLLNTIRWEYDK